MYVSHKFTFCNGQPAFEVVDDEFQTKFITIARTEHRGWLFRYNYADHCFIREDGLRIEAHDYFNYTPECKVCRCRGEILNNGRYTMEMDPCTGIIDNVVGLCCGHGIAKNAYIAFSNGKDYRGIEAVRVIEHLKRR